MAPDRLLEDALFSQASSLHVRNSQTHCLRPFLVKGLAQKASNILCAVNRSHRRPEANRRWGKVTFMSQSTKHFHSVITSPLSKIFKVGHW